MHYKFIFVLLALGMLLQGNILKIDKLVVRSIHIDSARGMSFKNMIIIFNKRKDAENIIRETFKESKYSFSKCTSGKKDQGCIAIKDSKYESK